MAKKRTPERKRARSRQQGNTASSGAGGDEILSVSETGDETRSESIEGASPDVEPSIDEGAGVDAVAEEPVQEAGVPSVREFGQISHEGMRRFGDLDAAGAKEEYARRVNEYRDARTDYERFARTFEQLEHWYKELDVQNDREIAFACRIKSYRLLGTLLELGSTVQSMLGELGALLTRRGDLKESQISKLKNELAVEPITETVKNTLARRLSLRRKQLDELEQNWMQCESAYKMLGGSRFTDDMLRIARQELGYLQAELDELDMEPMPQAVFENLLEEKLRSPEDGDVPSESDEGERVAEPIGPTERDDIEAANQAAGMGDAISEHLAGLVAGSVEARFRDEVAPEQEELLLEHVKKKAELFRHNLDIENQVERIRQKEELAKLALKEEEIKRQQQKWFFHHLGGVFLLDNRQASFLKIALVAFLGVWLVIAAITESAARQQYVARLDERIRLVKSEIIGRADSKPQAASPESVEDKSYSKWGDLERAQERTLALMSIGAHDFDATLVAIRRLEQGAPYSSQARGLIAFYVLVPLGLDWTYLSNDGLLGIILLCSGALGSLIIAIRRQLATADQRYDGIARNVLLGFVAGFIALLAMKGGKQVFVTQIDSGGQFFNPWSAAFLGIITGLFTDRAYNLLLLFVDKLEERIRLVFADAPAASASRANDTPKPVAVESAPKATSSDTDASGEGKSQQE